MIATELSSRELDFALRNLDLLEPAQKEQVLRLLEERDKIANTVEAREHFLPYVRKMWPEFIEGAHHVIMAEAFEKVARGEIKRLCISIGPRHGKSELTSVMLPSWFLGKFPNKKIIQVSNSERLAARFGRKVRNILGQSAAYREIFPNVELSQDSQAAAEWHTNHEGEYLAAGVGGNLAGFGADIGIVDDPHSDTQAKQAESNPAIFDDVVEWYSSAIRQRLQPNGSIIIVMCMTGDTPVLRPDGSETPLRDIRPGDEVATYENGGVTSSKVTNFRSNGVDDVYTIQTQYGRLLRANARHPFLVDFNGERRWVRLQNLKPGMRLVSMNGAQDPRKPRLSEGCAPRAWPRNRTTGNTLTLPTTRLGTTENGKVNHASNAVIARQERKGYVARATLNASRLARALLRKLDELGCYLGTVSPSSNTMPWSRNAAADAMYVENYRTARTPERIGTVNFASIISTVRRLSAGFFATTATLPSATEKRRKSCDEPLTTYSVTTDEVVAITPSGREEVFDVEIDRTENFIANGVVSHNTRWSKRDLVGQVLRRMKDDQAAGMKKGTYDEWTVIEFPAILDEDTPTQRPLWPGFWSLDELLATKKAIGPIKWAAQYAQRPTGGASSIFKNEHWRIWGSEKDECPGPSHAAAWANLDPPACDFVIHSWDTAIKKNERADYSAFTSWGVFRAEDKTTGETINNIILLSAWKARLSFPELKQKVKEFYDDDKPDTLLIEDKGSGSSLIQELRAMGTPVENFSYGRGSKAAPNDKIARANLVTDIFASGYVWRPETRFAEEVVAEMNDMPNGEHDDLVDATVQAMIRFRQGGLIRTQNDEADDEGMSRFRRRRMY